MCHWTLCVDAAITGARSDLNHEDHESIEIALLSQLRLSLFAIIAITIIIDTLQHAATDNHTCVCVNHSTCDMCMSSL